MGNKYLEKIAGLGSALKQTTPLERLGLTMSGTGLAMSAANLNIGLKRDEKKMRLEEKSLDALRGIHKTLEEKTES